MTIGERAAERAAREDAGVILRSCGADFDARELAGQSRFHAVEAGGYAMICVLEWCAP
jgi:hypothetical protein